jgi:hypothetical protein
MIPYFAIVATLDNPSMFQNNQTMKKQVAKVLHIILLFPPFTTHQCFQVTTLPHNIHKIKSSVVNKMQIECPQVDVEELISLCLPLFNGPTHFLAFNTRFFKGFGAILFLLANFSHVANKNLEIFWGF